MDNSSIENKNCNFLFYDESLAAWIVFSKTEVFFPFSGRTHVAVDQVFSKRLIHWKHNKTVLLIYLYSELQKVF